MCHHSEHAIGVVFCCATLQVAVKVLDSNAITRRDALTGLSLEVLLAERLRHPFIVNTKAWALVHGQVRGMLLCGPPCALPAVCIPSSTSCCLPTYSSTALAQTTPHLPLQYRHTADCYHCLCAAHPWMCRGRCRRARHAWGSPGALGSIPTWDRTASPCLLTTLSSTRSRTAWLGLQK